jgi:hypothetical protein
LARVSHPSASYILEFASKHHLKAILRYWSGAQRWSPFQLQPVEFVELNFDFHPRWIRQQLMVPGFVPGPTLTVSHFRLPLVKKIVPTGLLAGLDGLLQLTGGWWQLTPSVITRSESASNTRPSEPGTFFACPECQTKLPQEVDGVLACANEVCGHQWRVDQGLYDFKEPLV